MKKTILFLFAMVPLIAFELPFCDNNAADASKVKINVDNIKSDKSKKSMEKWLDGIFGLQPYHENYILPFGYANKRYQSNVPGIDYDNKEAEIKVSLKLKVGKNLLGLHELYYLSYTQQAFWQLYIDSSPFRESLYNPEAFVVFPISDTKSFLQMRSFKFSLAHKSNGQPDTSDIVFSNGQPFGNRSKSINYFYGMLRLQHNTLLTDITLLAPFPGKDNLSDNPDLMDYLGYTQIKFSYFYNEHMFTLMGRGNLGKGKGAVEGTYSYPLTNDSYFFVKVFSGYVESLIDYKENISKVSVGFSFSR